MTNPAIQGFALADLESQSPEFIGNSSIGDVAPWNYGGFFVSFPILRGIRGGILNRRDFPLSELFADHKHGPQERVAQLVEQRTFNP